MRRLWTIWRWTAPLFAGLLTLLILALMFWLDVRGTDAGLGSLISTGLKSSYGKWFALRLAFAEILPIYLIGGLVSWLVALALGTLTLDRALGTHWTWGQGFLISLAGLLWIHGVYWWEVPTTLWVLPGLARVPLAVLLLLAAAIPLAGLMTAFRHSGSSWVKRSMAIGFCILLWTAAAELPLWLAKPGRPSPPSGHPAKAILLGIDGMRGDIRETPVFKSFAGVSYPNVYTPLPATRMLYHLLWGGDPDFYSIATVVPSAEELFGVVDLKLLRDARQHGQKVRFFIDDGGTISISGRTALFDQATMPARGWENFVNSNLAVRVPLFAAWLDLLRVFPSTNPWSHPAAGLYHALEQGRGADWVIFHSCLAHQPIFLNRNELQQIPGWWKIPPDRFKPISQLDQFEPRHFSERPPPQDPYRAYQIRIQTILRAWLPLWQRLPSDPDYAASFRVLTSDHGERFYHANKQLRMGGVHGYGLDPWELRVPLVAALPGQGPSQSQGPIQALSLLDLRDAMERLLVSGEKPDLSRWGSRDFAPARFHTLRDAPFRRSLKEYREYTTEGIIKATYILPQGLWAMLYEKPAQERGADVSLAMAVEDHLTVFKPLKGGGAEKTEYKGYDLIAQSDISEPEFQLVKKKIETEFFKNPWTR